MRLLGCLIAVCISFLNSPCAYAQATDTHAQATDEHGTEAASEPVRSHRDKHHGHDHVYPDRGALFHELPRGAIAVHHAGLSYKFSDGVWYEPRGQAFIVVEPAIGAVVTALPAFATPVENGGESYLYANDIYYRARPDLGGYEVVNDPDELIPPAAAPTAAQPPPAMAAANPGVSAAVPAAVAATTLGVAAASGTAAAGTSIAPVAGATALPAAGTAMPVATAAPAAKVVATPKNGQSPDVQARDHYDCYKFAVAQSGFDPMHKGAAAAAQVAEQQSDYERAQSACFEGRGYSVH